MEGGNIVAAESSSSTTRVRRRCTRRWRSRIEDSPTARPKQRFDRFQSTLFCASASASKQSASY